MRYTIANIANIVGGNLLEQQENVAIEHLLTDSRRIIFPASSLFFALRGPRRDGHLFINDLYKKGIRNFVVSDLPDMANIPAANLIHVSDTLQALQLLAAHHRREFDIPVIGITGSNGKTIVKEWLNQLLEDRYDIVRSPKSYNSQIGVPLSVWQMNDNHELAIFEAGISRQGEMAQLENIICPTIGVLTNIGEAHSEGFTGIRQKILEKIDLFTHAKTIVYCKDHSAIHQIMAPLYSNVFTWGRENASLLVNRVEKKNEETIIAVAYDNESFSWSIPFTDDASIENAITCCCVLLLLGATPASIIERMPLLSTVAMRLELKSGINNCSVINDSYSADLDSLQIALDFLAQQHQHPRRTVILSDILQSGKTAEELYTIVAGLLTQRGVHRLIGIGPGIGRQQALFKRAGNLESLFYDSVDEFKKDFHHLHFRDETLLLKGARIFEFEQIGRLLEEKVHRTVLEINLNAVANNLRLYRQALLPSTRLMVMVKAFAYGSGSFEIANVLQYHKVDYLAVAYADEGVDLRKGGITLPIMVMNPDASTFSVLVQYGLEPELYSPELLAAFRVFLKKEGLRQFPVHIELETGMNRLGFLPQDMPWLCRQLQSDIFKVQSVFSHLVASEDPQHDAFTQQQAALFLRMSSELQAALPYPFIRHIANSAGITRHPDLQLDMVRLGIGLHGIDSGQHDMPDLQEVSCLKSTIAQIRTLEEGATVSYGRHGLITRRSTIATVRIGYADGYPRSLSNGMGKMWVNGHLAPISGAVCMDMTMIDITGIPDVHEGDEVIVFGPPLSVKQVAAWAHTIPYEILTGVSQRVKRIYFEE